MSFTPYDWNQSIQTRTEYVEERLREGSPVVCVSRPEGLYLASLHHSQRKIFEVYDRLAMSGIGNQSDIETLRSAAIDFCHREGFQRSPDDVTGQRLVGSVLSPALKRAFGDPFAAPFVFRGVFAELGETPEQDAFFVLGFDGEYREERGYSVIAGSLEAENAMIDRLHAGIPLLEDRASLLRLCLETWAVGRSGARPGSKDAEEPKSPETLLAAELAPDARDGARLEIAFLERRTPRDRHFRLLGDAELAPARAAYAE